MLLAIDIGNTHSVIALYDGGTMAASWRITTRSERTADEVGVVLDNLFQGHGPDTVERLDAAILASVVPAMTRPFTEMISRKYGLKCKVVGPGLKTGMPILYENPREVGADRIVNAVAAYERWPVGLIIVDLGTATTFDVVTPEGEYLGGAISPGIGIASEALFRNAARLPRVEFSAPAKVVGRNTVASIESGLVFGYVGLVEGLIARIRDEVDFECTVVATGGLAARIAEHTDVIEHVDGLLTMEGLKILYERNR